MTGNEESAERGGGVWLCRKGAVEGGNKRVQETEGGGDEDARSCRTYP